MKKIFFFAAIAAAALSSCSSDELVQAEQPVVEDGAVVFSAYQGRANRAANQATLDLAKDGFGVFAYEQGKTTWANYVTSYNVPNFMFNQRVDAFANVTLSLKDQISTEEYNKLSDDLKTKYNLVSDHYEPIGGWTAPTTYKDYSKLSDGDKAVIKAASASDLNWVYAPVKYYSNVEGALHSFFAYGPWNANVNVKFSTTGPKIHYNVADNIDLLWGHRTSDAPAIHTTYKDLAKQDINYKLDYTFEHTLTQVNVDISYFSDAVHNTGHSSEPTSKTLEEGTKIIVRSVKLIGPIATEGDLNLATGEWAYTNVDESAFEKSDIVFDHMSAPDKSKSVFDHLKILPPMKNANVYLQVVYDVETIDKDDKTSLNNHIVTNTWKSDPLTFKKGYSYDYQLHIGMTSVKFNANVSEDWHDATIENIDIPVTNMYDGFSPVASASILYTMVQASDDPTEATDGDYYWNTGSHLIKKYETDTWTNYSGTDYDDKFIKDVADGNWYKVTTGTSAPVTVIFFNPADGKFYDNYDSGTGEYSNMSTPTQNEVYVIGGNIYKKD